MAVQGVKSGARTWANLRLAIHEARSPLTVIAYASELLLEDGPDADPRVRRRHLDAIHRAAHEAAGCLTLLSRCVEVEEAAASPVPAAVLVEDLRDPESPVAGPCVAPGVVLHADPRLARHLAASLWEMASLFPEHRAQLVSAVVRDGCLRLMLAGPEAFLRCLEGEAAAAMHPGTDASAPARASFAVGFRAALLHRALEAMGGRIEPSDEPGMPEGLVVCVPDSPVSNPRMTKPRA